MNRIGIIGAMDIEVDALKEQMTGVTRVNKASMEFYQGKLNGKDVVVVRSGIGKVNAAVCTQILADVFEVEAVINTGIAGSLRNEINIGDIVVSTDALQHDMDAVEFGYPKGQIPGMIDISVRTDYLPTSTVDVMLDTTFEDADALAAYAKNPKHVAVADTKVRPFTANRACMDFEV